MSGELYNFLRTFRTLKAINCKYIIRQAQMSNTEKRVPAVSESFHRVMGMIIVLICCIIPTQRHVCYAEGILLSPLVLMLSLIKNFLIVNLQTGIVILK